MTEHQANYFSHWDNKYFDRFARWRTRFFRFLVPLLDALGLTPDLISYISLSLLLPVAFLFEKHPLAACILIVFNVILDGIDGCYARLKDAETEGGALTDIVCDQIGLIVVGLCAIYYQLLLPTWGAFYITIYIAMISLIVYQKKLGIRVQVHIRTKYILFFLYFIYAFSGKSYMNEIIPGLALIQTVTAVQSFFLIKGFMNQRGEEYIKSGNAYSLRVEVLLPAHHNILRPSWKGWLALGLALLGELLLILLL